MKKVIILANDYFAEALKKQMADVKSVAVLDNKIEGTDLDEKNTLFLYGAVSAQDKKYKGSPSLDVLVKKQMVIPVLKNLRNFRSCVPKALARINGMAVSSKSDIIKLKNRILERFGVIELNRKVFISYKRSDSAKLAQQLFVALAKERYIPFLDAFSIDAGADFQRHLLHELSDSSVFLFLNSPNYDQSRFTREELETCDRLQMAIIEVRTGASKQFTEAAFAEKYELPELKEKSDYDTAIDGILDKMERCRASIFNLRKKRFIDELSSSEPGIEIEEDTEKGILIDKHNKKSYYPLYHIPTSNDMHEAEKKKADIGNSVAVLYNGLYCRDDIKKHIKWLNKSLPIEAKDINEIKS